MVQDPPDRRVIASRRRITEAADRLFSARGYVATTIADIATEAGVAVQTIYNTVGNKAAVLNLVLDTAAAGGNPPGTVVEFMQARSAAATTGTQLVDLLADWFAEVHPRTAHVLRIIREAAAVDPEIAELQRRRDQARFDNYHLAARTLDDLGALPPGLGRSDIAASIWSLGHSATYAFLTGSAGWSAVDYHAWIRSTLRAAVLPSGGQRSHPD